MYEIDTSISLDLCLEIWDDLSKCYYGDNGFGGDTAEIYAYRLMPFDPLVLHAEQKTMSAMGAIAADRLVAIVGRFCDRWQCKATIDGYYLVEWRMNSSFTHRCHVKIIRKDA